MADEVSAVQALMHRHTGGLWAGWVGGIQAQLSVAPVPSEGHSLEGSSGRLPLYLA